MSLHSFPKIDQKEYLKKYLSGDKGKKKKKDKKRNSSSASVKVKIIDDDINHLANGPEIDEELLLTGDDAPQIVGEYIEELPEDKKIPKWKSIVIKDELDHDEKQNESYIWGRKSDNMRLKQESTKGELRSKADYSSPRRKDRGKHSYYTTPSEKSDKRHKSPTGYRRQCADRMPNIKKEPQSPPHRKNDSYYSSDVLPARKTNSDQSPPRRNKSPSSRPRFESQPLNRNHSDHSPTRRNKSPPNHSRYQSPARQRKHGDQSPPRKNKSPRNRYGYESPAQSGKYVDKSPPRRNKSPSRLRYESPARKRKYSDQSLPRRNKSPSRLRYESPARKRKYSDQSPPRRNKSPANRARYEPPAQHGKYSDQSPPRRNRSPPSRSHYKSPARQRKYSDQSPPRRNKSPSNRYRYESPAQHRKSSDQSPPRRNKSPSRSRYESPSRKRKNLDQSPPRRRNQSPSNRYRYESPARQRKPPDQLPPKRNKSPSMRPRYELPATHRNNSDQSPPRKSIKSPDQSPPRRRRNSDQLQPSSHKNVGNDSIPRQNRQIMKMQDKKTAITLEQSSTRRRRHLDESPPRRNKTSPSNHRKHTPDHSQKRSKRTQDLSPQPRLSRREMQQPEGDFSPPPTHKPKPGRTLDGKKSGLQDAKALQKETTERRKQEDILFETMSSDISGRDADVKVRSTARKGRRARLADEDDPEERRRKDEHEEKKKFLYDRWGKGLKQIEDHKNRMLEQQYESSKPLARYSNDEDLEKHLKEQERAEDPMLEYMRKKRKEKEKQSGKPQIPRYEGPYPENRFGIRPGYRWDGVDRSNGYEKKYFAVQNEKVARRDEAYKYSVEDM